MEDKEKMVEELRKDREDCYNSRLDIISTMFGAKVHVENLDGKNITICYEKLPRPEFLHEHFKRIVEDVLEYSVKEDEYLYLLGLATSIGFREGGDEMLDKNIRALEKTGELPPEFFNNPKNAKFYEFVKNLGLL